MTTRLASACTSALLSRASPAALLVASRHCRPPSMATSTCALLTSSPTQVPLWPAMRPPSWWRRGCVRVLTPPCTCGLGLAGPSNGPGSVGHGWDDTAGERSPRGTCGSAVCPTLPRATCTFAGGVSKIQGLLALDLARDGPQAHY